MTVQTVFKRIFRAGITNFARNPVVSITSVLIMTVTLLIVGSLILLNAVLTFALVQISERVDINVYFYPNVSEQEVIDFGKSLETLPEVDSVQYVSREEALATFRERHKNDYLTLQALEELDDNPLGASLNIHAGDSTQYAAIAQYLTQVTEDEGTTNNSIVERVNYNQNKEIIERLNNIMDTSKRLGAAITLVFIIISVLITFNTLRLAIYGAREEIAVMRLVGAPNQYIRGPFMVEGVLYGLCATIVSIIILFPLTLWLGNFTKVFFGGIDLFAYYVNNLAQIVIMLLVVGMLLGIVSSFIATRAYLRK